YPDGGHYKALSAADTQKLARECGLAPREVDIAALGRRIIPERYARNMRSFSAEDQKLLLESRVTVVGTGGLGGTVAETLARIGVGSLNLIDGDCFEESNLNRQLFSTETSLGKPKAQTAAARIASVNATTHVTCHCCNLEEDNAGELIRGSDLTVDCLDNLPARFTLQSASQAAGIPMVSAAVGGQAGQVTAVFPQDPGLELIYGPPHEAADLKGAERSLGNLPFAVTAIAALECSEVVKIILKRDSALRNRLLIVDLEDYTFERLRLT
ncbi:MAG: HesA/MoeB/ThiF family protein, partial [Deltaproteobacteria bacterium]|nr:HesA/MoeB/ThiF family protein [Deltaproteobacteria bacterium]